MKRCILLMPSAADEAWIAAIEDGLRPHGQSLYIIREGVDVPACDDEEGRVTLAFRPSVLDLHGEADRVVLACDPTRYHAEGGDGVEGLRQSTALLVEALAWPARVWVSDAQIEQAVVDGASLELFPNVWIRPPVRRTPEPAAAQVISMFSHGRPRGGHSVSWSPAYLTALSFKGEPVDAANELDMAGPPRPLVKGPYFTLPPGVWRIIVTFSLDDLGTRNEFRIEWGPPEKFVSLRSRPMQAGLYRVTLGQEGHEASYAELIIELMNGCIGGSLKVIDITVDLLSEPL